MQQLLQQLDYRLALLDAARRELTRLQAVQDQDRRRLLTDAALEALKAVNGDRVTFRAHLTESRAPNTDKSGP